jgi:hypothetical protein
MASRFVRALLVGGIFGGLACDQPEPSGPPDGLRGEAPALTAAGSAGPLDAPGASAARPTGARPTDAAASAAPLRAGSPGGAPSASPAGSGGGASASGGVSPTPAAREGEGGEVPRVHAKTRFVWVHYQPSLSSGWLGFLWLGGHAELKTGKPVASGSGCDAWYEVKPRGFVCVDKNSDRATLDPQDPVLVALRPYAPKKESPWPHRYGESTGIDRYTKLPSVAEQKGREYLYDEHQKQVAAARAGGEVPKDLLGIDLTPGSPEPIALPTLPRTLQEQHRRLLPMSTVAWSRDFLDDSGRSWLLSGDLMWVPKDRVKVYPPSPFHGVHLDGKEARLPLAFFRGKARPQYTLEAGASEPKPNGQEWPRLAWVQLTGKKLEVGKEAYWEVEGGLYVRGRDAVLPTPQAATPWGGPGGRRGHDREGAEGAADVAGDQHPRGLDDRLRGDNAGVRDDGVAGARRAPDAGGGSGGDRRHARRDLGDYREIRHGDDGGAARFHPLGRALDAEFSRSPRAPCGLLARQLGGEDERRLRQRVGAGREVAL